MNNNDTLTPQNIDNENVGLRPLVVSYLLHWKLILGVGIFACLLGIAYLVFYPKTYEAAARIQIQSEEEGLSAGSLGLGEAAGLMRSFGLGGGNAGSVNIDDEKITLLSNELMSEMVETLGLHVQYYHPYTFKYRLYGQEQLKVSCDSAMLKRLDHNVKFDISVRKDGSAEVEVECEGLDFDEEFEYKSLPAQVEVEDYTFVIDYSPSYTKRGEDFDLIASFNSPSWIAEDLAEEFEVEEYTKTSNVIEMLCQDYEKQRAKDMFNTLIACYNKKSSEYKRSVSKASLDFINDRLNMTVTELSKIELSIEDYKNKNKITMVEVDVLLYSETMKELQTKLIELEAQMHLISLMETFVNNPENKYKLVPSLLTVPEGESSPLALYNAALLERERMLNSTSLDNPLVNSLTEQADRLRESVFLMIANTKKSMDATRKDLKEKENAILSKMASVPKQERTYIDLKRQQEIYQGMYLMLLQKREEIVLTLGQLKDKARIIDSAYVKSLPLQPRKLFAAIGVVFFTLFFSILWIVGKALVLDIYTDFMKKVKDEE